MLEVEQFAFFVFDIKFQIGAHQKKLGDKVWRKMQKETKYLYNFSILANLKIKV